MTCNSVKTDYEMRKTAHEGRHSLVEIGVDHTLHRCLPAAHAHYFDGELILEAQAFNQEGWSVLIDGPGFDKVDLEEYLKQNTVFVAVVSVPASKFIAEDYFKFELLHDPFPTEKGPQHTNHGMVVCNKTAERRIKMRSLSEWSIKPPQN